MLRYAITDRHLFPGDESARKTALLQQVRHLATRNIDFLQLREKDLPPAALTALARDILAILRPTPTRLLINTQAPIAVATAAHGVHLPSTPVHLPSTPVHIRTLYTQAGLPTPTISLSCHTLPDITHALSLHPDLILFGPVFEKRVAGALISPGTGLSFLAEACRLAAPIPVLALGGITEENTPAALAAGAAGIAAIRLFLPR